MRIGRALAGPRIPLHAAWLGMLLCAPSLWGGKQVDDHLHDAMLAGTLPLAHAAPWDLFAFVRRDTVGSLVDMGILPWWTTPELHVAFFRPLASLSLALDHALWGALPFLAHLHSLLWYGALVLCVGAFLRRLLPAETAGLATLLFAIDDAHGIAVGWIAHRNSIMAMTFGLLVLITHDRLAREGWRPGQWSAPLLLLLGLLSAEAAIATTAYLFAYALFLDRRTWHARALSLVPAALVVLGWNALYRRLGYGAYGSGLYLDPLLEPLPFLRAALQRIPILLLGQLATPPADLGFLVNDRAAHWLAAAALAFLCWIVIVATPLLRASPEARFFALGMLLSTIPVAATFTSDRLLTFVGLGGMGLVATLIRAPARGRGAGPLAIAMIALHGILAPLLLPLRSLTFYAIGGTIARGVDGIREGADLARCDLVLVNPPSDFVPTYVPVLRAAKGASIPAHTRCLALGLRALTVSRPDATTLEIVQEGGLIAEPVEKLLRGASHTFSAGGQVTLSGMTATVLELTQDRRPLRVRFRFERPLDDPSYRLYAWRGATLVPFRPPAVGEKAVMPPLRIWDLL